MINSFLDTNSAAWVVLGLAVFVVSILITMWFFQRKRSQKVKKEAEKVAKSVAELKNNGKQGILETKNFGRQCKLNNNGKQAKSWQKLPKALLS